VIEDHIFALCYAGCVLASSTSPAHANADVPYDSIVGVGKGPAVAVDCDTISRCSLSKDADTLRDYNALFDLNKSADLEDDYAVGLRDRVAQGTGARVIQVGDNVYLAITAADGVFPKSFSTREGKS
jgi:hypothetical protein